MKMKQSKLLKLLSLLLNLPLSYRHLQQSLHHPHLKLIHKKQLKRLRLKHAQNDKLPKPNKLQSDKN